jgi:antitoxin (DNA-binding transcriptional repressor) of toxin-antitoxin stability system
MRSDWLPIYFFCYLCLVNQLNKEIMVVISTRDFRANQTKFFDMVNNGENVVLRSRGKGCFKLVPVNEKDSIVGKRDMVAELRGALQEMKEDMAGKQKLKSVESLIDELRNSTL